MSRATLDSALSFAVSYTWLSHSFARLPRLFYYSSLDKYSPQPLNARVQVWALPISLAATFGIIGLFSFRSVTKMFQFTDFPPLELFIHSRVIRF